jgi:hypothetical protein
MHTIQENSSVCLEFSRLEKIASRVLGNDGELWIRSIKRRFPERCANEALGALITMICGPLSNERCRLIWLLLGTP